MRAENGLTFDLFSIRAKGIGRVFRSFGAGGGSRPESAIYYRVDSVTQGSLAGTPFDSGQALDGLFF